MKINSVKKYLAKKIPFLGKYKRYIGALTHHISKVKDSYSQHNEDKYIIGILNQYNLSNTLYLDVGANHPTIISNTYLLYRNGNMGICIEPNQELINLHKKFRKKDIQIAIGCGSVNKIANFYYSKTPVLSSFKSESFDKNSRLQNQDNIWHIETLPVLKLDNVLIPYIEQVDFISLLNIDVEGMDFEVILGAEKTLPKTLIICIEFNTKEEEMLITTFLEKFDFKLVNKVACNLFFLNNNTYFERYKF